MDLTFADLAKLAFAGLVIWLFRSNRDVPSQTPDRWDTDMGDSDGGE